MDSFGQPRFFRVLALGLACVLAAAPRLATGQTSPAHAAGIRPNAAPLPSPTEPRGDEPLFGPPPLPAFDPSSTWGEPSRFMETAGEGCSSLWLVSTRDIECDQPEHEFEILRRQGDAWVPSCMEEFLASDDPRVPTSVFANGNNTNAYYADTQGRELRARMDTARGAARPVRYVIWSWSADKVLKRYLDDARAKLPRIEFESYLLADFASRISREVPLCLVGYSFGARLVGGTLHLLGGGELAGRRLPSEALTRRVELRAALVAGALDCHWFAQGMKLDAAMAAVDRLLVTTNPRDIVLDFYPILYQQEGPEAMGYTGPSTRGLPDEWVHKVELLDVMPWVEKKHRLRHYLDCPPVMASLGRFILFR